MAAPVFFPSTAANYVGFFCQHSNMFKLSPMHQSFFNPSQTLTSAPSETRVEMETAPTWWEASSAHAKRALSLVP